jgi:hypothetical protein
VFSSMLVDFAVAASLLVFENQVLPVILRNISHIPSTFLICHYGLYCFLLNCTCLSFHLTINLSFFVSADLKFGAIFFKLYFWRIWVYFVTFY